MNTHPAESYEPPPPGPQITTTAQSARQRFVFFTCVMLLTLIGTFLWADFLWRTSLYGLKWLILILFVPLFLLLSFGFCQSFFGFWIRRINPRQGRLMQVAGRELDDTPLVPTALLFPIYNENPARVFGGVRATIGSLREAGCLDAFEVFILSDTRDPETWIQEERAWLQTCQELNVTGRLHYRRRIENKAKKAGNISDFVRRWGRRYKYMIVFDADSLMEASTLSRLVRLMERYPSIGIIQTAPALCRGRTPFARMLQFANRFYGRIFAAGLNFWQQRTGNYWGHNAIIRIKPFADACDLPDLPWREPIGGKILSHDFVEAALMRRAGYEVWLAEDLEGTFEEGPPHLLAFAQRDRRWCQGNLQHGWLAIARNLSAISRLHFINGIFAYLGSFVWLLFLIISTLVVVQFEITGLSQVVVSSQTPFTRMTLMQHGLILLAFTAVLLYLPKILAWLDAVLRGETASYGGALKSLGGMLAETVGSALIAPVLMLFHSQFVVSILFGLKVDWVAQDRDGTVGIPLSIALRNHFKHLVVAVVWGCFAYYYSPVFFWWLSPVLIGAVFAAPITSLLASPKMGGYFERIGLWRVPEETEEPRLFAQLEKEEAAMQRFLATGSVRGCAGAVLDPYLNSLHVSLQEQECARLPENDRPRAEIPLEKALREGLEALSPSELQSLLASPTAMENLHFQVWHGTRADRHRSWESIIRHFGTRFA